MAKLGWRERRRLRQRLKEGWRALEASRDLLDNEKINAYRAALDALQAALAAKSPEQVEEALSQMHKWEPRLFPRPSFAQWQELVDVILVAAIVAFGGIRTFFVENFKIPSASMEPTLFGVEPHWRTAPLPSIPVRIFDQVVMGTRHIEVLARADGDLDQTSFRQVPSRWLWFFPSHSIQLTVGDENYLVPMEKHEFQKIMEFLPHHVSAGQPIVRVDLSAGDHLLVDRLTYNFRFPRRGEIVVFDTDNLGVLNPGQFYIKRLNGIPRDKLHIDPPCLYVNGNKANSSKTYERIYSCQDGYKGYTYAPEGSDKGFTHVLTRTRPDYEVPLNHYFVMGDNSPNSSDGRYWGPVPHPKFIGRALLVYWPGSDRFGLTY